MYVMTNIEQNKKSTVQNRILERQQTDYQAKEKISVFTVAAG